MRSAFNPRKSSWCYHVTGLVHDQKGFPTSIKHEVVENTDRLFEKVKRGFGELCLTETLHDEDSKVMIVAYGSVARSAREAMEELRASGRPVGLLKLNTLWPFPRAAVERFEKTVKSFLQEHCFD